MSAKQNQDKSLKSLRWTGSALQVAAETASKSLGMKSVEIEMGELELELEHPHFYEVQALQDGVRMFRAVTPADVSGFTDTEVMRMIRAICGDGETCATLASRIDSDHRAILRALNTLGVPLRCAHATDAQ